MDEGYDLPSLEPTLIDDRLLVRGQQRDSLFRGGSLCPHRARIVLHLYLRLVVLLRSACLSHAQRESTGESDLSKAVSLILHDKSIESISDRLQTCCPNLRTIDLSFNRISKIEGSVL